MSDFEVFVKMLNGNEKNVLISYEDDYLSKKGFDYKKVSKVGVKSNEDFIAFYVFDYDTGNFIEVVNERTITDEKVFIKLLDLADTEYSISKGTVDMDGYIVDTDDVEIQQMGSDLAIKFLFGKSSQSILGVVTEIKDNPKFA